MLPVALTTVRRIPQRHPAPDGPWVRLHREHLDRGVGAPEPPSTVRFVESNDVRIGPKVAMRSIPGELSSDW